MGSGEDEDGLFRWVVEGVLISIAFGIGVVGNSFSVIIFSRQKVHRIFHHLLLLLAIFDLVSIIIIVQFEPVLTTVFHEHRAVTRKRHFPSENC